MPQSLGLKSTYFLPPVTGTPGTGKTSLCHQLAASLPLQYINIGELVKEKELHDGWDEEYQSWNLNEDKVRGPHC